MRLKFDRTQAALDKAIPMLIRFMVDQGYPPTFELYQQTSGYAQTVENLQMTRKDIDNFKELWDFHLNETMRKNHDREVGLNGFTN